MDWVSRNETSICNIALFENMGSTYDGSLCECRPGTNQVVGAVDAWAQQECQPPDCSVPFYLYICRSQAVTEIRVAAVLYIENLSYCRKGNLTYSIAVTVCEQHFIHTGVS